ncbi:hypothetical protein B0A48_15392 [Cryoendolithus antarcticus]|uniref:Uncharacterized protein n=1 Tax=Cryoendolithus antarcticus TaxID=1507870 RepID=A0A1V8SHW0_9PEZI|nr:hypothetical protein B0A48_15392 [Cryoendolithus antarcticus]
MPYAMSSSNPNLALTPFGHSIKETIHDVLQKAADNLWNELPGRYDTEDEDDWENEVCTRPQPDEPQFTKEATKLIGAHVALVMEKCRSGRMDHWKEYVMSKDAEEAIAEVIKAAPPGGLTVRKKLQSVWDPEFRRKRAKMDSESKEGAVVLLRAQILADARKLSDTSDLKTLRAVSSALKEMMAERRI